MAGSPSTGANDHEVAVVVQGQADTVGSTETTGQHRGIFSRCAVECKPRLSRQNAQQT